MLTLLFFLISTFGLGFTATFFVKNSENFLERNLMRFGFGLSLLPFLGIALNAFRIPADWRIILSISLAYPIYYVFKNIPNFNTQNFKLTITKTNLSIFVMLLIFTATFYIYASGAFKYPYLEDDDSWSHANGIKFISIEKTVFTDKGKYFHYLNPYPPAYDLLFGILHQTNGSIYWTIKFFNALIVSLSIIFFYFFVKEFSGNINKALFAAFALASVPAFASHFIWALALTVPLYFVCFYALEKIKHDKKWWIVAALSMVTALTSSPTHSTYFGIFFILYLITKMIVERKILLYHILAGIGGIALSFGFWWGPMLIKYGFIGTLQGIGFTLGAGAESFAGTGDRPYTFSDFFVAREQNMINNPIGIGIVLSILTILGIIFLILKFKEIRKEENRWLAVTLVWFVFTLYAVNASRFPIRLSPFRTWMLFAIPVSILAAHGALNTSSVAKSLGGRFAKWAVIALLLLGIFFTSTQQKIAVNTAVWPPGAFWTYAQDQTGRVSSPELEAYVWMKSNLPTNSNVFTFANNAIVIGMDMYTCHWCEDVQKYKKTGFNQTAQESYNWLRSKDYKYLIIDSQTAKKFGVNETNNKITDIGSSGLYTQVFQNNGAIIFKI